MIQILSKSSRAYWLGWGVVISVYLFGLAALVRALRWW